MRNKQILVMLTVSMIMTNANVYATESNQLQESVTENVEERQEEEYSIERKNLANSWRYVDGTPIEEEYNEYARSYQEYSSWPAVSGAVAKGIDVGRWNGNIDWKKAKQSGVDYAIIQCGYGMDYASQDDPMWTKNAEECTKLGIPFGVYIYSYATNTTRAKSEAEHVLRLVKGYKLKYPIYYDLEEESVRNSLSTTEIAQIAKTFCSTIENAGYQVGIYANKDWFSNYLTNSVFDNWERWVAQYNYKCDFNGAYSMWQCSSKGVVDGISGKVDLNLDFGVGKKEEIHLVYEGGEYFCYQNNIRLYGEQKINGAWYYFKPGTGAMQTGFVNLGHKTVYYGTDGKMRYGEQRINGNWYYFNTGTGAMQTGFVNLGSKTVYYGSDGKMRYGEQRINGNWYYFNTGTGAMQTGFVNLGSKIVYYGADGKMRYGEQRINGAWYYFKPGTGAMQTGFVNLGSKTVYYGSDGKMRYGEQRINGNWYYFNTGTGAMQTGFVNLGSKIVYYGADGKMRYGEQRINGAWYYFKPGTGAMQTGFVNLGPKTVYYGSDGKMRYGEQRINGNWYYFRPGTGAMLHDGWYKDKYYDLNGVRK